MTHETTIPFPHFAWRDDPVIREILAGMAAHRISDMAAFDARRVHLMRAACASAICAPHSNGSSVVALMMESGRVGAGCHWSLSIGYDASLDEALAEWCDPYRIGCGIIDARRRRDWLTADARRAEVAEAFGAEVRIGRSALVITTAERGRY